MKLIIDEKVCQKHKMTLSEVLYALAIRTGESKEVVNGMLKKEILVWDNSVLKMTQHWSDVLDEIICDSSLDMKRSDEELVQLALKIMECFPKQRMKDKYGRDTPYYYRCNKSEVSKSLKRFFTQFGDYPDDDIIDATKRYVASFNGNYTGMRTAKYFIMKNPVKQGEDGKGYVEQTSDLLTFLENKGSEGEEGATNSSDWMNKLV